LTDFVPFLRFVVQICTVICSPDAINTFPGQPGWESVEIGAVGTRVHHPKIIWSRPQPEGNGTTMPVDRTAAKGHGAESRSPHRPARAVRAGPRGTRAALAYSILVLLATTACTGSSAGTRLTSQYVFDSHENESCHWATGQPAVCTITITNDAASTVTFNWHGQSDPAGATFNPDHGSVPPGGTSDPITVTDPFICPITMLFQDADQHLQVSYKYNDPCK
jgi:hypothetical protein